MGWTGRCLTQHSAGVPEMKGRPWYKRYPADILHGTMALNVAEKGAYNVVLDLIYDRGGPIPDDPKWLARQCGCSIQQWRTLRGGLIDHGKLTVTADGRLVNERATLEIARNEAEAEALREAGRAGGRARKSPDKSAENAVEVNENSGITEKRLVAHENAGESGCGTGKLPDIPRFVGDISDLFASKEADINRLGEKKLNQYQSLESRKKERKISSLRSDSCPPLPGAEAGGFSRWYGKYPRKDGRADACRAYAKALQVASEEEILSGLLTYQFSPERQFQPLPATWLNKCRWQHEPDTEPPTVITKQAPQSNRMAAFNLLRVYKQGDGNG